MKNVDDAIERHDNTPGADFYEFQIKNGHLLNLREYITFPYEKQIIIFSGNSRKSNNFVKCEAISYDLENDILSIAP